MEVDDGEGFRQLEGSVSLHKAPSGRTEGMKDMPKQIE